MHISDGVLSIEVAATLALVSVVLCTYSIKKLKNEDMALVASMSALFFIASFIHIPLGPTQVHLLLIGVIGLLLGNLVFLSVAIALLLQAILLGYGGLSSLGANIIIMSLPAYIVYFISKIPFIKLISEKIRFFFYGFLGIFFSVILLSFILFFSNENYEIASYSIFIANFPTMIIEGFITLFLLNYVKKSIPKLFNEVNP